MAGLTKRSRFCRRFSAIHSGEKSGISMIKSNWLSMITRLFLSALFSAHLHSKGRQDLLPDFFASSFSKIRLDDDLRRKVVKHTCYMKEPGRSLAPARKLLFNRPTFFYR